MAVAGRPPPTLPRRCSCRRVGPRRPRGKLRLRRAPSWRPRQAEARHRPSSLGAARSPSRPRSADPAIPAGSRARVSVVEHEVERCRTSEIPADSETRARASTHIVHVGTFGRLERSTTTAGGGRPHTQRGAQRTEGAGAKLAARAAIFSTRNRRDPDNTGLLQHEAASASQQRGVRPLAPLARRCAAGRAGRHRNASAAFD